MTRQPRFRPDQLDGSRLLLYRSITEGPRSRGPQDFPLTDADGALRGPFGGFLLSPAVGEALQQLGAAVRYGTHLTARVREIAILAVAARRDSRFERHAHESVGRVVGLTEVEMLAIREGVSPDLDDAGESAALRINWALLDGDVDDRTWSACVPPLDPELVFELITLVGYYSTLALQMRVLRVDPPTGD
jgi:4-carboxymuconolactone decarboxylase